ncbi:hypothetical protein CLU79DRAFT_841035 [Phycomyces nitens]|nr:hypothetical protein CLU79DRAFT_841035 [Phycomyces nitens]
MASSAPLVILEKIVNQISWKDKKTCLLVCKGWHSTLRSLFDSSVDIRTGNQWTKFYSSCCDTLQEDYPVGKSIRSITVRCPVPQQQLFHVLVMCQRLQSLLLSPAIPHHRMFSLDNLSLCTAPVLSCLKTLYITLKDWTLDINDIELIHQQSPFLQALTVVFPSIHFRSIEHQDSLESVQKCDSLKYLHLVVELDAMEDASEWLLYIGQKYPSIETFCVENSCDVFKSRPPVGLKAAAESFFRQCPNLKSLELNNVTWSDIMIRQMAKDNIGIRAIKLDHSEQVMAHSVFRTIISYSFDTLSTVWLSVPYTDYYLDTIYLDLEKFRLSNLTLKGYPHQTTQLLPKISLNNLPNIENLTLDSILVVEPDYTWDGEAENTIKRLTLRNSSFDQNALDSIAQFTQQLTHLIIDQCKFVAPIYEVDDDKDYVWNNGQIKIDLRRQAILSIEISNLWSCCSPMKIYGSRPIKLTTFQIIQMAKQANSTSLFRPRADGPWYQKRDGEYGCLDEEEVCAVKEKLMPPNRRPVSDPELDYLNDVQQGFCTLYCKSVDYLYIDSKWIL